MNLTTYNLLLQDIKVIIKYFNYIYHALVDIHDYSFNSLFLTFKQT